MSSPTTVPESAATTSSSSTTTTTTTTSSSAQSAKRRYWSAREVMALKQGVFTHGVGKWSAILLDPTVGPILSERTNVNLKDKWRSILRQNGLDVRTCKVYPFDAMGNLAEPFVQAQQQHGERYGDEHQIESDVDDMQAKRMRSSYISPQVGSTIPGYAYSSSSSVGYNYPKQLPSDQPAAQLGFQQSMRAINNYNGTIPTYSVQPYMSHQGFGQTQDMYLGYQPNSAPSQGPPTQLSSQYGNHNAKSSGMQLALAPYRSIPQQQQQQPPQQQQQQQYYGSMNPQHSQATQVNYSVPTATGGYRSHQANTQGGAMHGQAMPHSNSSAVAKSSPQMQYHHANFATPSMSFHPYQHQYQQPQMHGQVMGNNVSHLQHQYPSHMIPQQMQNKYSAPMNPLQKTPQYAQPSQYVQQAPQHVQQSHQQQQPQQQQTNLGARSVKVPQIDSRKQSRESPESQSDGDPGSSPSSDSGSDSGPPNVVDTLGLD